MTLITRNDTRVLVRSGDLGIYYQVTLHYGRNGPTNLTASGPILGFVQDRGFWSYDGDWVERWSAYAGGAEIERDQLTMDDAIGALVEHVNRLGAC